MNPALGKREGPRTDAGQLLAQDMPKLVVRIRAERIDTLAMRLESDAGANLPNDVDAGFARVCVVEGERLLKRVQDLRRQKDDLLAAIGRGANEHEQRAALQHFLRTTSRDERALAEDLRGLNRSLDAEALAERIDAAIQDLYIELELVCYALAPHPLRGAPATLLQTLMDCPRAATRRVATGALVEWMVWVLTHGEDRDNVLVDVAREQMDAMERAVQGADLITARRAMRMALGLPERQGQRLLVGVLQPDDGVPRDFLLRAEAVRLMVQLGAETGRNAYMMARQDPSETVRCALVDALLASNNPGARNLLQRLRRDDPSIAVQVRAARGMNPAQEIAHDDVISTLAALRPGDIATLRLPEDTTPEALAEQLVEHVERDHGFGIQPLDDGRVRVRRGTERVVRSWRLLHEFRNPQPGKRLGGDHVSGQHEPGAIVVPSQRMADVSPTDVPGRPILHEQWRSWGPWLPLPDTFFDALWEGRRTIITKHGRTQVTPPSGLGARMAAAWKMTWQMSALDGLRQASLSGRDAQARGAYVRELERLGFEVRFDQPSDADARLNDMFPGQTSDPLVLGVGGIITLVGWVQLMTDFVAQRTIEPVDLLLIALGITVIFFGRLVLSNLRTRRARKQIPLVVGGWGTRGKSGVARLKAALFDGLGYNVVCKTTGCEAMFLRSQPMRGPMEFYLFRPFDKATIWEHAASLQAAAELRADVFVWECMALRPTYVEQLQLWWTRDDVSTVTNTYPDHEDIQGPTGHDVATAISSFIPENALALTTEVWMTPVLRERARERNTELVEIHEDVVEGLPTDLMERLPYREHPANISLVAELAEQLGVDREEAILLMAEHVVPDLGSLATFPPLRLLGRTLEFTNGSSANERTGFLNNWRRCGFASHDPHADAEEFLVVVVNNRYDRVSRSQVFAELLAYDAPAHRYVLIGTNLEGLQGYLRDALARRVASLDVFGAGPRLVEDRMDAAERGLRLADVAELLRGTAPVLGVDLEPAATRLEDVLEHAPSEALTQAQAMELLQPVAELLTAAVEQLTGAFDPERSPESLFHDDVDRAAALEDPVRVWMELAAEQLRFASLRWACLAAVRPNSGAGAEAMLTLESAVEQFYMDAFLARVVVVEDPNATGDQINRTLAACAPLGSTARILSSQNIKGTGLDLVYRWVFSRKPMGWARGLHSPDKTVRSEALEGLKAWHQWSEATCNEVLRSLALAKNQSGLHAEVTELVLAERTNRREGLTAKRARGGVFKMVFGLLKGLVDPFIGVLRRWRADQIVRDLAAGRISSRRAEEQLRMLTLEQRGEADEFHANQDVSALS
jgi:poly-gamma-glutamate synthase PgsB/CapB